MKKVIITFLLLTAISIPQAISASNPYGAPAVDPAGPNETILTVLSGGKSIKYRMADLLALKPVSIQLNEPFVKKRQTFSVIPLSVLLAKSGIKPTQKVSTKALNDYIYANTGSNFAKARAFIALKRDGKAIPYDQGGPIRLVYPDSSMWSKYLDPWNWSLSEISAK